MNNLFWTLGALLGAMGVALGAFGAHGLRSRLTLGQLQTFETGVRYHLIHVPVLLLIGWLARSGAGSPWLNAAGWLIVAGTLLFSGSLYLLALTDRRWLGAITPLGGIAFIAGWLCLAAFGLQR
jgi:uncharacterized membrane protein YgdD (TMEM256/DUF423 family)